MGTNHSLLMKGLVLIAVPFLAQMLFVALLLKIQADNAQAQQLVLHTKNVISQAEILYRQLLETHTNARAYVVLGREEYWPVYRQARLGVEPALTELQKMVRDNPEQLARLRDVAEKTASLMQWIDHLEELVRSGARAAAFERIANLQGKGPLDGIRGDIDAFLIEEQRLDEARLEDLRANTARQGWALAVGSGLALLTAGFLALVFTQGITRRLGVVRDNTRRLAEGRELEPPLTGGDEIAEVDHAFHDMAEALARQKEDNELFVYSVSHDLRSPLVNLQGFSEELGYTGRELRQALEREDVPEDVRRNVQALVDRDMRESLHFIRTSVSRLGRIIDALLRLSRAGRVEYQWQPVDVQAAVSRVVTALGNTLAARGAEVRVGDLPPAWGDPGAVEQAFANLLGNAVNYLDPGRPGRVEVGSRPGPAPGLQTYFVKDNGLGIAAAYQKKVFTAFQRLHGDAAPGEGIGLALVRRVAERHGGRVWLESTPGTGSTFYLALPATGSGSRAGERAGAATRAPVS